MCNAFSCVVLKDGKTIWEWGIDSHDELCKKYDLNKLDTTLDKEKMAFARVEIVPTDDWLNQTGFKLVIDEEIKPIWFSKKHEDSALTGFKQWKEKLDAILKPRKILNPFTEIVWDGKITKADIKNLRIWSSVWDSVWDSIGGSIGYSVWSSVRGSVWGSIGYSVWSSVRGSVGGSVWDSIRYSIGDSVWNSVYAQIGSLFHLSHKDWKYTEKLPIKPTYPFQSAVDLWNRGLVPVFDGKEWMLLAGKDAKVVWEGELKE